MIRLCTGVTILYEVDALWLSSGGEPDPGAAAGPAIIFPPKDIVDCAVSALPPESVMIISLVRPWATNSWYHLTFTDCSFHLSPWSGRGPRTAGTGCVLIGCPCSAGWSRARSKSLRLITCENRCLCYIPDSVIDINDNGQSTSGSDMAAKQQLFSSLYWRLEPKGQSACETSAWLHMYVRHHANCYDPCPIHTYYILYTGLRIAQGHPALPDQEAVLPKNRTSNSAPMARGGPDPGLV